MKLFTIGSTKKSAERFFNLLSSVNVMRIVDIRLKNESQLAGFAKKDDLKFFLKSICDIDYIHISALEISLILTYQKLLLPQLLNIRK